MEEERYRDGHGSAKPEYVKGGGRNRGYGNGGGGGGGGGGAAGGGLGRGEDTGEKAGKFMMDVCPQNLRFTQDSIGIKFKPPCENLYIYDAVQQIRKKVISPAQFPPLNVVEQNGILWSLDNRRLWVFRKAGVEEISVNLVPRNFSPRSSEFFTTLNAALEKTYSDPMYYPSIRGTPGNVSCPDPFNVVKFPGAGASLPSLPTRSPQQKVTWKPRESDPSSIMNDAAEDSSYLPLLGLEKENEGSEHRNLSRLDHVNGTEITGAANVSSFPKLTPVPKVMPSVNGVPNPKILHPVTNIRNANPDAYAPLPSSEKKAVSFPKLSADPKVMPRVSVDPNPKIHHHVINIRNANPDAYVPLPSSEKGSVSENAVIRFVKKLFYGLRCGTAKVCMFWFEKALVPSCKFLHDRFKGRG